MIIDCHGHYTTEPIAHHRFRDAQVAAFRAATAPPIYPAISDDALRESINFELEPADERTMPEELSDSIEALLMEGMRQLDEFRMITGDLPAANAPVSIARPLGVKLRDLGPEELDVFQLAVFPTSAQALMDHSRLTDLDTARCLLTLLQRGYLVVG